MLVDIEFAFAARLDQARSFFSSAEWTADNEPLSESDILCTFGYEKIQDGVYYCGLNSNHAFSQLIDQDRLCFPEDGDLWQFRPTYGVADTADQVLDHVQPGKIDNPCVITLTPVFRHHQPERDGWRWCRWGEYIGTRVSQADYLYDEPEIDMVLLWHLWPLNPDKYAAAHRSAREAREASPAEAA